MKARAKYLISSIALIVIIALLFLQGFIFSSQEQQYLSNVEKARSFLTDVLYDSDVGLCKESPFLVQNRYGLQSDNYLASKALNSEEIENRIFELGFLDNCKYGAVFDDKVFSLPFVIQEFKPIYTNYLASDFFNRDTLGNNWTSTGATWTIEDGWLKGSGDKHLIAFNQTKSMNGDVTVKMKMTEGSFFGVVLRYVDPRNFIVFWLNTVGGGEAILQQVVEGSYSQIDFIGYPVSLGEVYTIRFELIDNIHRVWINDLQEGVDPVLQGSRDTSLVEGYAGVMIDEGVTAYFDDFSFVDYRIFNAFDTERIQSDYEEYTDLCFVASAVLYNQQKYIESIRLYEIGLSYWDGFGFKDTHLQGEAYLTYQLALAISVSKKTGYNLGSLQKTLSSTLWNLQREDGGITTHYLANGQPYGAGEPNTEVTSLAILSAEMK